MVVAVVVTVDAFVKVLFVIQILDVARRGAFLSGIHPGPRVIEVVGILEMESGE